MHVKEVLVLFCILVVGQCGTVPDYIHVCNRDDPQLAECIKNSVTALIPRLKGGIPELNIPSIDPLKLGKSSLETESGNTHLKVNLGNLLVTGASDFTILELTPKLSKNYFHFKANHPKLYVEGDYEMDTKLLVLQLKGKGRFHFNITNFVHEDILKGHIVTENGEKHLKFEKMKIKIGFESATILLENLFNGDPVLGKAANEAINDNVGAFFEELRPNFEEVLSNRFTEIANKITKKFNYDDLFPKSSSS